MSEDTAVKNPQTIEIDCPPGEPRPDFFMDTIIARSGLNIKCPETSHRCFGEWGWDFSHLDVTTWGVLKATAREYLTEAHNQGLIRYAGW